MTFVDFPIHKRKVWIFNWALVNIWFCLNFIVKFPEANANSAFPWYWKWKIETSKWSLIESNEIVQLHSIHWSRYWPEWAKDWYSCKCIQDIEVQKMLWEWIKGQWLEFTIFREKSSISQYYLRSVPSFSSKPAWKKYVQIIWNANATIEICNGVTTVFKRKNANILIVHLVVSLLLWHLHSVSLFIPRCRAILSSSFQRTQHSVK